MDADKLRAIIQHLLESDSSNLNIEDCEDILSILLDVLKERNGQLPLRLVINGLFKLATVIPNSLTKWENVVKELCHIVKTTTEARVLGRIFGFFFAIPRICPSAFNTIVSVLPTLHAACADIRNSVIQHLSDLICEDATVYKDDYPSEESLSILVSLLNENDKSIVDIVARCIEGLVNLFLKSDRGINNIMSTKLMEILLEIIKAWEVDKQLSPDFFQMIIRMYRNSQLLRSKMLGLGFDEVVGNLLLTIIGNLHTYDVGNQIIHPVLFLKELVTHSENLQDQVWSTLALHLSSIMVALEPHDNLTYFTKDLVFQVLEMLLKDATDERINTIIKSTNILPYLSGILNYSNDQDLIGRSTMLLQAIEYKHEDLVHVPFAREGVFEASSRLQRTISSTFGRYNIQKAVAEAAKWKNLNNLTAEIKKQLSLRSAEAHEIVLKALKEISKVDGDGKGVITGYEFIKSGFANTFLVYLLETNEAQNTKSKKRARNNSIWEDDDCNMEEGDVFVNFRVQSFISRCLKSGEDISEFLKSLALVLSKALSFMSSESTTLCITDHRCLAKTFCLMKEEDPKHDYMLLANIVDQASCISPSLEAESVANATYQVQIHGCPAYFSSIKAYRANSLPIGAMKCESFTHYVYKELEKYLDPDVSVFPEILCTLVNQYPFMLSVDARKLYLDMSECLGEKYWERELHYINVNRNSLLLTSRVEIEEYCYTPNHLSMLFVQYEGEQGSGRGPTTEFFTIISDEFQKHIHKMWRGDATTGGLFPRPWPSEENIDEICLNFKLLGQIMAIALRDNRLLDIHLSQAFYKVALLREELSLYDVFSFDEDVGKRLLEFNAIVQTRKTTRRNKRRNVGERTPVFTYKGATFRDMGLEYIVPGFEVDYNIAKYPGQKLGLGNLEEYVEDLHDATVGNGVRRQIFAFQSGFSQVLSLSALQIFRADEMDSLFCGQKNIDEEWTTENLHKNIEWLNWIHI